MLYCVSNHFTQYNIMLRWPLPGDSGRTMDLKTHIGLRVKAARRRAGLSQEELAEKVGKAVETISNIERGHSVTGLETLEALATCLKTPLVQFFEDYSQVHQRGTRKRALAQQRVMEASEKLTDEQLIVAARLLNALRD